MRILAILAAAIAINICNHAADAQEEKKAAPYSVKAEDCKTAASCRVQCKEPDHFLVSAICLGPPGEKGKYLQAKFHDEKHKASCPPATTHKIFAVCMKRAAQKK